MPSVQLTKKWNVTAGTYLEIEARPGWVRLAMAGLGMAIRGAVWSGWVR
jgi:hypothetical protein